MNIVKKLTEKQLIQPPRWLPDNIQYMTITGSKAYGCNNNNSDLDIYGYAVPPKEEIFGDSEEIVGFDVPITRFQEWQKHGIVDGDEQYDLTIFSIVKFFHLLSQGNPNCLDTIFTPSDCKIYTTPSSELLIKNRHLFLSKEMTIKFLGYSHSQIQKLNTKKPTEGTKRWEDVQGAGFDRKYSVHLVRLLLECEQLLLEGDLDMRRNSSVLSDIRAGKWTKEEVLSWFKEKEIKLKDIKEKSILPEKPDIKAIRKLLLDCINS